VLETFWRKVVQRKVETGTYTLQDFFLQGAAAGTGARNWLGRAREYRLLGEPLDIVNWYFKNKHIQYGNHYITGLVNETTGELEEYTDSTPKDVKDNGRRPSRYRVIQELEVLDPQVREYGEDKDTPQTSLELGRLLRVYLGTTIPFESTDKWPAELRAAVGLPPQ
jgi:hypothetical protein